MWAAFHVPSLEEIAKFAKNIRNKRAIGDWEKAESIYQDLVKHFEKSRNFFGGVAPKALVRCISETQTEIDEKWSGRKKLSKLAGKALASLRQKIRKFITAEDLEERIQSLDQEESEAEAEEDDASEGEESDGADEDDGEEKKIVFKPGTFTKAQDSGSETDSDSWGGDGTDSDSSDSDDGKERTTN